jgi:hypothetical protein
MIKKIIKKPNKTIKKKNTIKIKIKIIYKFHLINNTPIIKIPIYQIVNQINKSINTNKISQLYLSSHHKNKVTLN